MQGNNDKTITLTANYPSVNGTDFYLRTFAYDEKNRLTEESEANRKTTLLSYLHASDLVKEKWIKNSNNVLCHETYEYDANFFLISKVVENGSFKKITRYTPRMTVPYGIPERIEEKYISDGVEKLLHATFNHYTKEGYLQKQEHYDSNNVLQYTLRWEYDKHGNVRKEVDALGQETIREYDENDNLVKECSPSKDYANYEYDSSNRLTKVIQYDNKNKLLGITSHSYDYLSNRIMTQDLHGNQTLYGYDAFGRVTKVTYPKVCDGQKQAIQPTEEFQYDVLGHLTQKKDKRGYTTIYEHNIHGKPLSIRYPDGTSEQFIYNPDGTLKKSVHKDLSYTTYAYDCLGHLLKEEFFSSQGELYLSENLFMTISTFWQR